jgi:hypothetical protein
MNIEFNLFRLKKDSKTYKHWSEKTFMQKELDRDIIIVGEEKLGDTLYLRRCTIQDGKLSLIGGLQLNDIAYHIPEEDLEYTSCLAEFNIHKKYLSMGLIEDIQIINERLVG